MFTIDSCNKVHFVSLGCPRNLVDTEVMLGLLLKAGYEVTQEVAAADYLVVNTCAFLEASRRESKEAIQELLDKKKPEAKLIVAGCMVSRHREEIEKTFPNVHYLLGSGDVEGILTAVASDQKGEKIGSAKSYLEAGEIPRQITGASHFAYLKIAEGCRKACAYCIIPQIKGPLRSKPIEQLMREFKALLAQGIVEIILIAQDLGDWGKDRGKTQNLATLIRELLTVEGDYWLRLLYLYPDEIDDELIGLMQQDRRICPYLDMPIQHINDRLLKSMRRHITGGEIKSLITKLRQRIENIHIRTSLIVGFPGETQSDFEELCAFVQQYPINHIGIFPFSREKGSRAYDLPDQIEEAQKKERVERLSEIQQKVIERLQQPMIGQKIEVVIEGYHPESRLLLIGRHRGQCPDIDGQVILNEWDKVTGFGERYLVEITSSAGYDLIGRVIKPLRSPMQSTKLKTKINLIN